MTANDTGPVISGLLPEPKRIEFTGGDSELAHDVRLVTSNVLPMQRKGMRGILTSAGVRVVANKKKYVIEAKVEPPEEFDFAGVPEECRSEYYELEVQGAMIFIRASTQEGVLWGTQTLAAIFKAVTRGEVVPNMIIKDWPVMSDRGIFVECKWGPDRMDLMDWSLVVDRIASLKMNRLGIGVYGCWGNCRFEGKPTEFLMVPVPEHEELVNEQTLKWYSPRHKAWQDETYKPFMYERDFFGDVVQYASEKGVKVVPFVNSLGHNTLIPRILPELSAKTADGEPTGVGYSIAAPQTREFIEAFYSSIIERYYPEGIDLFHIQMDEVWPDYPDPDDPKKVGSPWCEAPESKKQTNEENLQDYILWLVKMLTDKGVGKVVMWNDQLTRHMDVLGGEFVKKLEDAGLKDRVILHWWWYSNDALNDQTHVALGKKAGIEGWVAPMTCYFNWMRYDFRRKNIEMMMKMGLEEGARGTVSYSVHDPAFSDHEALMAVYAWSGEEGGDMDEIEAKYASRFGEQASDFLSAIDDLIAVSGSPALGLCYHYTYTYCNKDVDFPRAYPGEALDKLLARDADTLGELAAAKEQATSARTTFAKLVAAEEVADDEKAAAKSLMADGARIEAIATAFAFFVTIKNALADGSLEKAATQACADVRAEIVEHMELFELNKPDWVVPASLQSLSVLLTFLDQLKSDLKAVLAGKKNADEVRWTV
ncbi:MAG: family 20 glycosylhydrolase [Lentisphaeria bacterium]|nr:family 20 glycosylhydrolase [Lentisphaeria bacterium]